MFHELSISDSSFGWPTVFATACLQRLRTEKKENCILLDFCCTLTVLEGISNWINNCLIPISLFDPTAQTEKAVSYRKEKKLEANERQEMTPTDT